MITNQLPATVRRHPVIASLAALAIIVVWAGLPMGLATSAQAAGVAVPLGGAGSFAILAGSGINLADLQAVRSALEAAGARAELVAPALGQIAGTGGDRIEADKAISTVGSVMYDAVLVPGGPPNEAAAMKQEEMRRFIVEAYWHGKTIGATGDGVDWLSQTGIVDGTADPGIITTSAGGGRDAFSERFIAAIAQHRHWERLSSKQK